MVQGGRIRLYGASDQIADNVSAQLFMNHGNVSRSNFTQ